MQIWANTYGYTHTHHILSNAHIHTKSSFTQTHPAADVKYIWGWKSWTKSPSIPGVS